ncbi:RAD23 family protein [Streptomyces phaeofaciens]|uniref:hypothetical protein n=1 Tax=Streptomyces phaeofaciens TaxID=68254 RepID=UPI003680B022
MILDDPSDPLGSYMAHRAGLPRAPEPHTERPGTSHPPAEASEPSGPDTGPTAAPSTPPKEEARVAPTPTPRRTAAAGGPLPAQHRTDITFEEYLVEAVNIAVATGADKEEAVDLAKGLEKVADALRAMAADLAADHAIDTRVTTLIADLADAADRMKKDATWCATECGLASEAAVMAAGAVGRVYGQDQQAVQDAGLAHASAAVHY